MNRASLDLGSARCALVLVGGERGDLRLVERRVFEVGHLEPLPEPVTTTTAKGKTYTRTHKRVRTEAELDALVTDIAGAILPFADLLVVEVSDIYLSDKAPIGRLRAQAKETQIADRIAARVIDRCKMAAIKVESVARVSWLAALRRHASTGLTPGVEPIPQKVGAGAALDPLIRAHLPAIYEATAEPVVEDEGAEDDGEEEGSEADAKPRRARMPGADVRDAAAMLLSTVLEIPPKATAARAPRAPREKGEPKGRRPMTPERREAVNAARRADAAKAKAASGSPCTCRPVIDGRRRKGRCAATCPAFRPKWNKMSGGVTVYSELVDGPIAPDPQPISITE